MALRLLPRDDAFQRLFAALAEQVGAGAREVTASLGTSGEELTAIAARLAEIEQAGDECTHEIIAFASSSYVTPLDREDIHGLALALDGCLNHLYAAVDLKARFGVGRMPDAVAEQVDALSRMADLTASVVPKLRGCRSISDYWVEVNRLENVANRAHRAVLADLYDDATVKAKHALKVKAVADELEAAADAFEHVAHVVEGIAIKGF